MADTPPHINLLPMLSGYWVSQAIHVAARLGLEDLVKVGQYVRLYDFVCGGIGGDTDSSNLVRVPEADL